jgi:glycosyltransferase involved in cell wall biosynthesis
MDRPDNLLAVHPARSGGRAHRMRLVLTVNYSPWSRFCGGGQRSTHRLAEALSRRGHRVSVVYTKPPWERVTVPDGLPYDVHWAGFFGLRSHPDAPFRIFNAWTVAKAVATILAREPVDIVHSQGEEGALLPRLRDRVGGFRVVVTSRYPAFSNRPSPKFLALGHLVRHADTCCVTSRANRELLSRFFDLDPRQTRVVPNGIDPEFLGVTRQASARNGPIVFFGRVEKNKGVDTLIEALAKLRDQAFLSALIIGRGTWQRAARVHAKRFAVADRVDFRGWLDSSTLASTLATARLAVLPSRDESFGNAIVEAMGAGVPVLSTRAGSIPEVTDDGQAAMLVPASDADQLARAIAFLVRNPDEAEALGRKGRSFAAHAFSWSSAASLYEQIYTELVDRSAPRNWCG